MVLFSILKPGTRIAPHNGFLNTRLICHLPLIVPDNCAIRVGNETRTWKTGEMMIFDDSIEHEAWNESEETRVVLIFDIWRPDLTIEERESVSTLLQAIDSYS
jgi:aspartyl/asparaginyl beta-hydroxylase (cupin superfamily)